MAVYGRLFNSTGIFNFLNRRFCMSTAYQNISKKIEKRIAKNILPPAPKKPLPPFFRYMNNTRPVIKKQYPELKAVEIAKKASEMWKQVDPELKLQLHKEYDEEYRNYVQKVNDYENSITDEHKERIKEERRKILAYTEKIEYKQTLEVLGRPKKPLSGFFLYLAEIQHKRSPDVKPRDWIRICAEQWRALPSEVKQEKYLAKAAESMKQYNKDIKEWEQKMIDEGQMSTYKCKAVPKWTHVPEKDTA